MADLARALLTEKIRTLNEQRRSGVLVVTNGEASKGIFLRSGRIVFASSTVEREKLGENLIRLGRISRQDFVRAYRAAQGPKKRLGQALVGAGLITEEELSRLVAHQVQKIVLSTFTWTAGSTRFHEAAEPIPADLALELSTHRLLLEGARIYPDVGRLERALGPLDRKLRVSARPPFDFASLPLSPAEKVVLDGTADGERMAVIVEKASLPRPLVIRALYALQAGGILEESRRPDTDSFEVDTGTFRLALAAATPAPAPEPPGLRERILALYEKVPRATHYEVLQVSPSATLKEIEQAHGRQAEEQERTWEPLAQDVRLGSIVATLRLRRKQAYHVLTDPERRAAYDRSLLKPAKAPAVSPEQLERASRLSREAQRQLDKGQRDRAVELLLEAVRVAPRERTSRRLLALTLADEPSLRHAAERHFIAALEAEPADHELRCRFSEYYRVMGLPDRAVAQLRSVLDANPRHAGAARMLQEMGARPGPRGAPTSAGRS